MRVTLHRCVGAEVDRIMDRYEAVGGPHLADEFYSELSSLIRRASQKPERFRIIQGDLRRANLKRFPYHFLSGKLEIQCEYWLFAIIDEIPPSV